jgi:opacity protein-like surface antigen
LYYSLSAGVWLPAHTSSVDASLKPTETHYNAGIGIGGAIGIDLGQIFRLENELSYRYSDAKSSGGNNWALAWMLNGWIETRNYSPVTPYFGGGFGLGRGHISTNGPSDGDVTGVAYQVGGGLDIRLDRRLSLDIGYRYFGISDTSDNNGTGSNDLAGSSVLAGLRVRF